MKYWYQVLCRIVVFLGIPRVVRCRDAKRRTTIILYHDPRPEIFVEHIRFLSKHFTLVALQDFLGWRQEPRAPLPQYSLIVTFDDGNRGNYELLKTIRDYTVQPPIYV